MGTTGASGRLRSAVAMAAVALSLLVPAHAPTAHADDERSTLAERWSAPGTDAALRTRVVDAATRGVRFLRTRLRGNLLPADDRTIVPKRTPGPRSTIETTALGAWTLSAVGTDAADALADRTLDALFPADGRIPDEVRVRTLPASAAVLALTARGGRERTLDTLTRRLRGFQDADSGLWGDAMLDGGVVSGNLFASHMALLALRTARRRDAATSDVTWQRYLARVRSVRGVDGAASLETDGAVSPVGTCLAAAGAALAGDAVAADPSARGLAALGEKLAARAERALRRDAEVVISLCHGERERPQWMAQAQPGTSVGGPESHLDLFVAATALASAGIDELDGWDWRLRIAEALLATQNPDGGWGRTGRHADPRDRASRSDETCYALLVLCRATDPPRHRVTGRETSIEVAQAWPLLTELEQVIADPSAPLGLLRASLDDVTFAWFHLHGERDAVRHWRDGALLLVTRLAGSPRKLDPKERRDWTALQISALDLLSRAGPSASAALRGTIDRAPAELLDTAALHAAFHALARQGDVETVAWLLTHVEPDAPPTDSDVVFASRTRFQRVAVLALGEQTGLPGAERLLLAWRLLGLVRTIDGVAGTPRLDADLPPAVLRALRRLCRDPATGHIPDLDAPLATTDLDWFERWLHEHDDAESPPWK